MMSVFLKERTVSVGGQNRIEKIDFVARRWSDNNSGVSFFRFEYPHEAEGRNTVCIELEEDGN